eukprot:735765-Hanusia_phi.AAC.1
MEAEPCLRHARKRIVDHASTGMASRRVTWGKSLAEKLAMLPHGAKPTKREDARPGMRHWTKPLFSKRHLKEMKKEAEAQGLAWP